MDMSPMQCFDCGPTLVAYAVLSLLLFFFPIGTWVMRRRWEQAHGTERTLLGVVVVLGVIVAPFAGMFALMSAALVVDGLADLPNLFGASDIRDILAGVLIALALRVSYVALVGRDRLAVLRIPPSL